MVLVKKTKIIKKDEDEDEEESQLILEQVPVNQSNESNNSVHLSVSSVGVEVIIATCDRPNNINTLARVAERLVDKYLNKR